MGTLQEGLQTLKDAYKNAKSLTQREDEMKAKVKPGVIPAALSKEQKEQVQLTNERNRNPKEFDAQKAMYDSALQQDAESKKRGGCVKMAKGGYVRAADGIAMRGKTKGRIV